MVTNRLEAAKERMVGGVPAGYSNQGRAARMLTDLERALAVVEAAVEFRLSISHENYQAARKKLDKSLAWWEGESEADNGK